MDKKEYIFGSKLDELKRLGFQHKVWSEEAFRVWKDAGINSNQVVLDIGAGPGFASTDLSHFAKKVIAVERSEIFCEYLKKTCEDSDTGNIEILNSDLNELTLFEKVDLAYSRWVMSWLENPKEILERIDSFIAPNGKIIFQEYCYWGALNMEPYSEEFARFYKAARRSFDLDIGEVDIGYKLPEMLKNLGYDVFHLRPLIKIGRPKSAAWNWVSTFANIYGKKLVESGLYSEDDYVNFLKKIKELESNSAAYYSTPQMIEIIARKR